MTDTRNDLPPVNSPNFLEKVREALSTYLGNRGSKLDRGLTVRDLADAGLVDLNPRWLQSGGKIPPIAGPGSAVVDAYEPDLTPPPTPTGFAATAAISNLMVECAPQTYTQGHGHAKSRLYGATWTSGPLPVFADAVVITEFSGTVASHATNPATTWHLWLTWVTVDGVESSSPAGGTNGVVVRTGEDVALLLEALTDQITESQLHNDLGTRIDLIDGMAAGSVNARLAAESAARVAALAAEETDRIAAVAAEAAARANALAVESQARANAIAAEANTRLLADAQEAADRNAAIAASALAESTKTATAIAAAQTSILSDVDDIEASIRTDLTAADATLASSLTTSFQSADVATLADAKAYTYSKASIDGSLSGLASTLTANFTAGDTAALASAKEYAYSKSEANAAIAAKGSELTTAFTNADNATLASAQNYTYSKSAIDSAITSASTTLSTAFTAADATTLASAKSYAYSKAQTDSAIAAKGTTLTTAFTAADAATLASANNFTYSKSSIDTAISAVEDTLRAEYTDADAATLASAQSYTYSQAGINSAISAAGSTLTTNFQAGDAATLASAQNYTYSKSAIDASDAATLSTLRAEFTAADAVNLASAQNYTYAKATIDSAIATSATTLRTQLTGGSTATDLNTLSSGLLYQERIARAAQDAALSQQITLLSAGAGEQFDYSNIWYFDSGVEGWSGDVGTTVSAVNGWLRMVSPSGTLSDKNFYSPDNLGIEGAKYPQVRVRVRKVGAPTWDGNLRFTTIAYNSFATADQRVILAVPSFDANGISVLTFDMPAAWTSGTIKRLRLDLATAITPTDYFELDWVAVGRPSPGASSAQLAAEELARATADSAEAAARMALEAVVNDKASATAVNELSTRVTSVEGVNTSQGSSITTLNNNVAALTTGLAAKADATALTALTTRVTSAEGVNTSQGTSITTLTNNLSTLTNTVNTKASASALSDLTTRVTNVEGVNTSQGTSITTLNNNISTLTTNLATKADATALTALTTRVTDAEGVNTTQSGNITTLTNTLTTLADTVNTKASASALNDLTTRVTAAEGVNTSQASSITSLNSSLTTTNTNVTAAQTAATNAATLAGSKGKVLVQSTAPAVADRLAQNLWIDTTSNANTPKRWNGTAWTAVTDKVATDAAAAAAAAQATANLKADVTALNALTTIVTGQGTNITAQGTRLTSLESTVNNATTGVAATATEVSTIKTLVNNATTGVVATATKASLLESKLGAIGGENLLYNPSFEVASATAGTAQGWYSFASLGQLRTLSQVPSWLDGGQAQRLDFTGLGGGEYVALDQTNTYYPAVESDQAVAMSAYFRATPGLLAFIVATWRNSSGYVGSQRVSGYVSATGLGQRVEFVPTVNSGATAVSISLRVKTPSTIEVDGFIEWDRAQVELGTTVSGWRDNGKVISAAITSEATTRATEDSALSTRIDTVNATLNNATTGLASKASIGYVDTAKADAISTAASATQLVQAQLNTGGATQLAIAAAASAASAAQTTANTAVTNAATAQTAANTANTAIADIASDAKLTPVEKSAVRNEWNVIAAEKAGNNTQATTFGITTENTAYNTAFQALATYLNNGTTWSSGVPSWIADASLSATTTIVGATFRTNFATYYAARTALLNAIALKAKALADAAQTQANTATTNAATAQTTANTAVTNAAAVATRTTALETSVNSGTTGLATKASVTYVDTAKADAISASATSLQQLASVVETGRNAAGNVLSDSSLELGGVGWQAMFGKFSVALGEGRNGGKCLKVVGSGLTQTLALSPEYTRVPVQTGQKWRLRCWYKTTTDWAAAGNSKLRLNSQTGSLVAAPVYSTPVTDWTPVEQVYTVAAGVTSLGLGVMCDATVGTAWLDDFEMENITTVTELSSAIQTEATTRATQTGELYAQYTVKLDVGGKVSGYGLASSSTSSEFAIRADRFYIAPPATGGGTATQILPFVVQATATTINGVSVPAGVYMDGAYIKDLTAPIARLGNAWVDDAKIANVSAAKLTAGSIGVGQYIQSTSYVAGSAGWRINGDGTAEFSNAVVRGTVYATAGEFRGVDVKTAAGEVILSASSSLQSQVGGGNLCPNPDLQGNLGSSTTAPGWTVEIGGSPLYALRYVTDGGYAPPWDVGQPVFYGNLNSVDDFINWQSDLFPVNASKVHCLSAYVINVGASSTSLGIMCYNSAQVKIGNYAYYTHVAYPVPATWTRISGLYGPGQPNVFPAGTAYCRVVWYAGYQTISAAMATRFCFNEGVAPSLVVTPPKTVGLHNPLDANNITTYINPGAIGNTQIGGDIFASNWFSSGGANGWYLDRNGNFYANSGTFKGNITGASGTFGGNVHGGQFTTGAFTGYVWPAAGNYGTYLGPSGLRIGNANNGKYLQVTQDGNIYSPGFDVVEGTMTVKQANVINTLNIAGNAVTVPVSAFTAGPISIIEDTVVQSLTITSEGEPIYLFGSFSATGDTNTTTVTLKITRNGTMLTGTTGGGYVGSKSVGLSASCTDTPGVGTWTYTLLGNKTPGSWNVSNRSLIALGVKR